MLAWMILDGTQFLSAGGRHTGCRGRVYENLSATATKIPAAWMGIPRQPMEEADCADRIHAIRSESSRFAQSIYTVVSILYEIFVVPISINSVTSCSWQSGEYEEDPSWFSHFSPN